MNNIEELIEIIKNLGGSAESHQILKAYFNIHKMIIDESFLPTVEKILRDNPSKVSFNITTNRWELIEDKDVNVDTIIKKILGMFENGKLVIEGKKVKRDNLRYRIAIPNDNDACDILVSSQSYKVYSYKELKELDEYFTKYSEREIEHRPYQYHIPVIKKLNRGKMIVCRVAYMDEYKGISKSDKPTNGGQHVKDTGHAEEAFNFYNIRGNCYGFVETKHTKTGENKRLTLENIDESFKGKEIGENVKAVFVALNPETKKTVVVGWYDNANVYRNRQYHKINKIEHQYNIVCDYEDAHLIKEGKRVFEIPNAAVAGNKYGIGQSNIWYIQKHKEARKFEDKLLEYLENVR